MGTQQSIPSFGRLGFNYGEQDVDPPDHHHVGPWAVFQAFSRERDFAEDRNRAALAMRYLSVDPASPRAYLLAMGRCALNVTEAARINDETLDDVDLFVRILERGAHHRALLVTSVPPVEIEPATEAEFELKQSAVRSRPADAPRNERDFAPRDVLLHPLVVGSLGEAHLALRREPGGRGHWVLVKLLDRDFVESPIDAELRRVEANLRGPNVCPVLELGRRDGVGCHISEYQHGLSLAQIARQAAPLGGMPTHIAATIVSQAARGLAIAHGHLDAHGRPRPIVHRDISPQALLVMFEGATRVLGFGMPRPMESKGGFTRKGDFKGRPAYMAPEQLRGHSPDPTMDVWSLGVILWEIIVGRRLFTGATEVDTIAGVLSAPIPRPSSLRKEVDGAFDEMIFRALDRDPAQRYRDAGEFARALEATRAADTWAGNEAVAHYVQTRFAAERDLREALLQDLGAQAARNFEPVANDDARRSVPALFDEDAVTPAIARPMLAPIVPDFGAPPADQPKSAVISGVQAKRTPRESPIARRQVR